MIRAWYDPGFVAPIGEHIMPMRKFAMVAEEVRTFAGIQLQTPEPVTREDLLRVHTAAYIDAVRSGEPRTLAESQKFPWSPDLYASVLLTGGAAFAAAGEALTNGISAAIVSGFHHACADHGEGFCTFNGLIVALEKLRAEGRIGRAAILDLDLHYGNGTATLAAERPWIRAVSIYGNEYWANTAYRDVTTRRHADGENHVSFAIPAAADGAKMSQLLDAHLPELLRDGPPDLLLYQAGADPLRDDPYSPLELTAEDLYARDKAVFAFAKNHRIPIAWVLAGGYTPDTRKVVQVHVNTFRAALDVYGN